MKEDYAFLVNKTKEDNRIKMNVMLLGICFTMFTFLIAFNAELLKQNIFLTLQLVCSIPLFMTSLLARSKASYTLGRSRWTNFGFITYLLAYSFLINVVGIFLISFISVQIGIIFFILNMVLAVTYSFMEVSYDKLRIAERFVKDLVFVLILVLLGILPALRIY